MEKIDCFYITNDESELLKIHKCGCFGHDGSIFLYIKTELLNNKCFARPNDKFDNFTDLCVRCVKCTDEKKGVIRIKDILANVNCPMSENEKKEIKNLMKIKFKQIKREMARKELEKNGGKYFDCIRCDNFAEIFEKDFYRCLGPNDHIFCIKCKIDYQKHQNRKCFDFIKFCPKCFIQIHKITGCNHMTCRCGQEFCYVCGKEYEKDTNNIYHKKCECDLF
jgi:hypothetical protein